MAIRLGLQISSFSYVTPVAELFPSVISQAVEAEAAGFDTVLLTEHFYQLPMLGAPEEPMLEAYTALAGLALATKRAQLGTLVTGNTYRTQRCLRNPCRRSTWLAVVAPCWVSVPGWFEIEHDQLGFEFSTFTDRFNRLEEALQIIVPMLRGEHPTLEGKWYHAKSALNNPRIRDDLPILLGGGGERKTFSIAARLADHLNILAPLDDLPMKLKALAQPCEEYGRDPNTLETSTLVPLIVEGEIMVSELPLTGLPR
jgi:alkanesulfonate monooxygenase SsuD/methylene tetrahydromethanopterin reductase-like flavin-dependent oxidoreductase (luciferase family)